MITAPARELSIFASYSCVAFRRKTAWGTPASTGPTPVVRSAAPSRVSRSSYSAYALVVLLLTVGCEDGSFAESDGGDDLPDIDSQLRDCVTQQQVTPGPWIDCVVAFEPAPLASYGHEALEDALLSAPQGSLDVVSLGCGGAITLGFAGDGIVDGEGPDLIVFENPFAVEFPEPARVEVSEDGMNWQAFPCSPARSLAGCAGVSVVTATPESGVNPLDPDQAGGDAFDLAELGLTHASYVRLVDDSAAYWNEMRDDYCDPGQGGKGGFDLDSIAVLWGNTSQGGGG